MLLTTFLVVLSACTVSTVSSTRMLAPGEPDVALPDPATLPTPPDAGR
jgi:hypothetical protein